MHRIFRWLLRAVLVLSALLLLYVLVSVIVVRNHESLRAEDAAPTGGRFVDVDGVRVFTQRTGTRPDLPVVLLVHGTAAWSGTWFELVPTLVGAGYTVIAVDLPPFGYSSKATDTDFSRTVQARRLRAVLDAYGVKRARVVGHSFGGGPALELALQSPHRVEQLVLIDAALGLGAHPDPHSAGCRLFAMAGVRDTAIAATAANPLWSRALLRSFVARKEAVTTERLRAYRAPAALQGASAALAAWGRHFACDTEIGRSTQPAEIRRLQVPLQLIWGNEDSITPLGQAQQLQLLVPSARLQVINRAGHIPHIEQPRALASALLQALEADDGVTRPASI